MECFVEVLCKWVFGRMGREAELWGRSLFKDGLSSGPSGKWHLVFQSELHLEILARCPVVVHSSDLLLHSGRGHHLLGVWVIRGQCLSA